MYYLTTVILDKKLKEEKAKEKAEELKQLFELVDFNVFDDRTNYDENFKFKGLQTYSSEMQEYSGYFVEFAHYNDYNYELKEKLDNNKSIIKHMSYEYNTWTCDDCGCEFLDEDSMTYTSNGHYVCSSCLEDDYFCCDDCGEYYPNDDIIQVDNGDRTICNYCYSNGEYYRCAECEEIFSGDSDGIFTADGAFICDDCRDDYTYCDHCGEYYHNDDIVYVESIDGGLCRDCYEEFDDDCYNNNNDDKYKIYGYHAFNNWKLYHLDDEKEIPFYIGFENEVEVDNYYDLDYEKRDEIQKEALKTLYDNLNIVCANDSSLTGGGGFEIISHPQTFKYIIKNKEKIKEVFEKMIALGYISHNSPNCGLHFHITRPNNEEIINRIWYILEFYKKEVIRLSRRSNSQIEQWCNFLSDMLNENERKKLKSYEYVKGTNKKVKRYMALNNTNTKTIELRFFRGTLNYNTFMASIEFVNNLITLCSNLDLKINQITWYKLTRGEFISKYVKQHEIYNKQAPKDLTYKLLLKENKQIKLMNKITRKLLPEIKKTIKIEKLSGAKCNNIDDLQISITKQYNIITNYSGIISNYKRLEKAKNEKDFDDFFYYLNNIAFEYFNATNNIDCIKQLRDEFKKLYNTEVI